MGAGFVGLFPDPPPPASQNELSGSIRVDAQGGMHLAYMGSPVNGAFPVRYGHCASQCGQVSSWTFTNVADGGNGLGKVLLALDPQGHPRIGFYKTGGPANNYAYASCDTGCTAASGWTSVLLGSGRDVSNFDSPDHFFALDPQGNPGMLYDDNGATHTGLFYATCSAGNCTGAGSWQETALSTDALKTFYRTALVYDAQSHPHFAYDLYDQGTGNEVFGYAECNGGGCTSAASWSSVNLYAIGGSSAFALAVNGQGQPRFAYFNGSISDPTMANTLVYGYCNGGCTSSAAAWSNYRIGTSSSDGANGLDLALNAQGLARVAFHTGGNSGSGDGVAVAVCDGNCESTSASWHRVQAFLDPAMDTADPIPPAAGCTTAFWIDTTCVTLAIDAAGNLAVANDAKHIQGGGSCTADGGAIVPDTYGVFLGLLPAP